MASFGAFGENLQGRLKVARPSAVKVTDVQTTPRVDLNNVVKEKEVLVPMHELERFDPSDFDIAPTETECGNMYSVLLWNGSTGLSEWMTSNNFTTADGQYCANKYGSDWYTASKCDYLRDYMHENGGEVFYQMIDNANNNYSSNDESFCRNAYQCAWEWTSTCDAMLQQLKLGGSQGLSQWMSTNGYNASVAQNCQNTWYRAQECNDILDLVEANPGEYLTTWLPNQGYSFGDYAYCVNL